MNPFKKRPHLIVKSLLNSRLRQNLLAHVGHVSIQAGHINESDEPDLVGARPGVIARQHAFEGGVLALNRAHRVVNDLANLRQLGFGFDGVPAGFGWQPGTFAARFSAASLRSGSSLINHSLLGSEKPKSNCSRFSSNASEMYLRKMRPRQTCLYSEASM